MGLLRPVGFGEAIAEGNTSQHHLEDGAPSGRDTVLLLDLTVGAAQDLSWSALIAKGKQAGGTERTPTSAAGAPPACPQPFPAWCESAAQYRNLTLLSEAEGRGQQTSWELPQLPGKVPGLHPSHTVSNKIEPQASPEGSWG